MEAAWVNTSHQICSYFAEMRSNGLLNTVKLALTVVRKWLQQGGFPGKHAGFSNAIIWPYPGMIIKGINLNIEHPSKSNHKYLEHDPCSCTVKSWDFSIIFKHDSEQKFWTRSKAWPDWSLNNHIINIFFRNTSLTRFQFPLKCCLRSVSNKWLQKLAALRDPRRPGHCARFRTSCRQFQENCCQSRRRNGSEQR